jgi:hypothetical protein
MGGKMARYGKIVNRLLRKGNACFDKLSVSGNFLNISIRSPLVPSQVEGRSQSFSATGYDDGSRGAVVADCTPRLSSTRSR